MRIEAICLASTNIYERHTNSNVRCNFIMKDALRRLGACIESHREFAGCHAGDMQMSRTSRDPPIIYTPGELT